MKLIRKFLEFLPREFRALLVDNRHFRKQNPEVWEEHAVSQAADEAGLRGGAL